MPTKTLIVNRKSFIVIFLAFFVLSLITFHFSLAFAETTPLDKADADYAYQYGKYVDLHENYLSAKSTYTTFKTATAKNDAYLKTKDYLKQVHNVYISYLLLAKEIGNTFDWGDNAKNKNAIAKNLDAEISFFAENSKKLDKTQTLEELPQIALDLNNHITDISNPLINGTLVTYNLVETQTRIKQLITLAIELDNYAKNKLPAEKYNAFFANWNSEIKKIQQNAQKALDSANIISGGKTDFSDSDVTSTSDKTQAIQLQLKQANTLFEEVLRL